MAHDHATVAEEEYLQTIFWLQEAGLPMTGANVARAMQLSAPTVHEMIGRLERDGYVTRAADKAIVFTENGREHAEGIVRRHRLIERFLTDILEIPWDEVHEEAERLEHWMSPQVEAKMMAAIGDAKTCPHGHPIQPGERIAGVPLADAEQGAKVQILRFENEAEELLHLFKAEGFEPGREGVIAESDERPGRRRLRRARPRRLTRSVAETVSVTRGPVAARRAPRCPSSWCSRRTATAGNVVRGPSLRGRRTKPRSRGPAGRPAGRRAPRSRAARSSAS